MIKKDTIIIGLGNCGSKIAKMFQDKGYSTMFANGSAQDLKVLGNAKGIYKLEGFDGFGGDRSKAMDCLLANEDFTDALAKIQQNIIVLIYAAGGSTGSGLSNIVANYLSELYDNQKCIINVPVLPSESEDINKHKNAYQCMKDLSELEGMGATFVLDNTKAIDGNVKWVNQVFVSLLDGFLTDDSWGEENNFDSAEKLVMLNDEGMMYLEYLHDSDSKVFADKCDDRVVSNMAIIHSDRNDIGKDELIAEYGKPINTYQGYGAKKTMIAVSGLSLPFDTIRRLGQLAKEGQAERRRMMESRQVNTLDDLDFDEPKKVVVKSEKPKKNSLLAMRKKMGA